MAATAKPTRTRSNVQRAEVNKEAPRGRPPKRVFINVLVRESTRTTIKVLTKRHGLTQGELLDHILQKRITI
jgi:hypothetical protein